MIEPMCAGETDLVPNVFPDRSTQMQLEKHGLCPVRIPSMRIPSMSPRRLEGKFEYIAVNQRQ
jgi:hypothetical protein